MKNVEKSIIVYNDYGNIKFDIKTLMDKKEISINKMVKITGLHHKVVERYYNGEAERYDKDILSKFCYVLDCELSDIMKYEKPKEE